MFLEHSACSHRAPIVAFLSFDPEAAVALADYTAKFAAIQTHLVNPSCIGVIRRDADALDEFMVDLTAWTRNLFLQKISTLPVKFRRQVLAFTSRRPMSESESQGSTVEAAIRFIADLTKETSTVRLMEFKHVASFSEFKARFLQSVAFCRHFARFNGSEATIAQDLFDG